MKANELRLNNLIKVKGLNEFDFLDYSVEKCNYHHIKDLETCNPDFLYEPIPLTEEWLLRFGFILEDELYKIDKNKYHTISVLLSNNFCMPFIKSNHHEASEGFSFYGIKYVHQLQNLYFALTNTELIWNGE